MHTIVPFTYSPSEVHSPNAQSEFEVQGAHSAPSPPVLPLVLVPLDEPVLPDAPAPVLPDEALVVEVEPDEVEEALAPAVIPPDVADEVAVEVFNPEPVLA